MTFSHKLHDFWTDEQGSTALEYGLILALIFMAIVSAVTLFANNFNTVFQAATKAIVGAG